MRTQLYVTRILVVLTAGLTVGLLSVSGCGAGSDDAAGEYNANSTQGNNLGTSGAQDIGQFRKILEEGEIPGENTLDANGFFSEHHTQLPEPDCGQTICLHGMLAVSHDWIYGEYQATLQLGMNTTIDASELERLPLDLVVVVDTSGSMAGDGKMTYVREGLHLLVDAMQPGDRLALVRYDTDVHELAGLQESPDATTLHALINELWPDGATNFYGGLQTGLQLALDAADPERESRVIMLSDGMPTAGIYTDDQSIIDMADDYIRDGVGLTTIGVGLDFNVELMRGLAERGAGNFYFLEDAAAIDEVFTEEIAYFTTPIAYDLELEVVNGAAYQLGDVVGTKLWSTDGYRGTIQIPAVFLAGRVSHEDPPAEDPRRRGGGSAILVNLIPVDTWSELQNPYRAAELRLRYRLASTGEVVEQTVVVQNPQDPGVAEELPYYSHSAMEKNHAMYNIFLGLREACRLATYSHNQALWILEQIEAVASAWNAERDDQDIVADLALIDQFIFNLEQRGATAVNPEDPDATDCGYEGCYGNDIYYEEDHTGLFFCSTGRARDTSPVALALLLVVLGVIRRRRRARSGSGSGSQR